MSKFLGVAIEDAYLPYDLLFYKAPDSLEVNIGSRVLVPLGKNNKPKLAYVLTISNELPDSVKSEEIKSIIEVVEKNLFSSSIALLFRFVSQTFLIPIHSLLNKIYGTYTEGELTPIIKVVDPYALSNFKNSLHSEERKLICDILIENSNITLERLKQKSKTKIEYLKNFLRELEKKNLVELSYKIPYSSNKLLTIDNFELFENIIHKKGTKKSVRDLLLRIQKNNALHYNDAIYKIRDGLAIVEELLKEGVIKEVEESNAEPKLNTSAKRLIIDGGSLKERISYISKILKNDLNENGVALIIVNENSLVRILSELYKDEFPGVVFGSVNKEKNEIKRQLRLGKRIIISTPFSLFVDIPNLQFLIVEDASSKYHIPHEFLPFDTRIVSYKKSELENISLILSTYSLDDTMYFFHKEKSFELVNLKDLKNQNKRIIDMRREAKSEALSPLTSYLESKIRKALLEEKNVALILNRKPYSTLIVCTECGYVHRCPVCESPLFFDKEKNILFCSTCGHEEEPIESCPRCGSLSLLYLGYGIQKLSYSLKSSFKEANLIIIEGGEETIYDSTKFKKTIFLGTEAIFSHLKFDDVALVAFVSADTFLNGDEFNTSFEAFKYLRQSAFEIFPRDIFIQTYEKDNYILENFKKDNELGFIKTELSFRYELYYPPFAYLYEIRFSERIDRGLLKLDDPDAKVYGPAERIEDGKKFYEISIRTKLKPKEFYNSLSEINQKRIRSLRVYPAPSIVDYKDF